MWILVPMLHLVRGWIRNESSGPFKDDHMHQDSEVKNYAMLFAIMNWNWTSVAGRPGTQKLAADWATILSLGQTNTAIYPVDPGRLLLVCRSQVEAKDAMKFLLKQDSVDFLEINGRPFYPNGRKAPLITAEERRMLEREL